MILEMALAYTLYFTDMNFGRRKEELCMDQWYQCQSECMDLQNNIPMFNYCMNICQGEYYQCVEPKYENPKE